MEDLFWRHHIYAEQIRLARINRNERWVLRPCVRQRGLNVATTMRSQEPPASWCGCHRVPAAFSITPSSHVQGVLSFVASVEETRTGWLILIKEISRLRTETAPPEKSIKPLLNHLYYAGPPINNRCYSKRSSFVLLQYWGGQTFTSNRKCPAARTSNSNIVSFLFSLDCKSLDCFILSFGEIPDISRYHNWLI